MEAEAQRRADELERKEAEAHDADELERKEAETQDRADELDIKRLEHEMLKARGGSGVGEASSGGGVKLSFKMMDLNATVLGGRGHGFIFGKF